MTTTRVERVTVTSSSIASVGYVAVERALDVEFLRGHIYRFFGVPEQTFANFLAAISKGRYFNAFVRDHFRCERVRP